MQAQTIARVLVVDDEIELMQALCEMLAECEYETFGCGSAEEALNVLRERDVDLLITDLMMPGVDGITLLRQAQEIQPYLVGIVTTGQGTIQTAVDAMKVGAFDYVLKPFRLSGLLPTLARAAEVGRLKRDNLQLRETVAIYELSQTVALAFEPSAILEKLAEAALEQCAAESVSVLVPTPDRDALSVVVVRGEAPPGTLGGSVPLDDVLLAWVDRHRESPAVSGGASRLSDGLSDDAPASSGLDLTARRTDGATDVAGRHPAHDERPAFDRFHRPGTPEGDVSVPLLSGGRLIGVLRVSPARDHGRGRRGGAPLTPGQVKALSILAGTAAAALESASLHAQQQAREQARVLALERAARAEAEVERAARAAAEKALAIRDEFLAVAAHELKTPMTSLLGAVQLLLRQHEKSLTLGPDHTSRALQIVDRQTTKLGRLVVQLLEVARLDAGPYVPNPSPMNLSMLLANVVEQMQAATDRHELVLAAGPAVTAHLDANRVEQVISNLLDNAIKFSPDGGRIDVELSALDDGIARLAVRDRGLGFPPEYRERIFERYVQAHAESHRSGMGLGLYISRRIVELHGGRIEAELPDDGGARFVVHLPLGAP